MKLLKAMVIAFSIYSKIPVPQFEWKEEDMEYMMCFFPWIGGVIGLFFYGWTVLCEKLAIGNVCYALIGAAIPLMISGGFHVDGYMDTMDAFHSYQSREKKLEILKDSHIGAFAAIMLALYYMIDIAAISEIHTQKAVSALAAVFFLARCFSGIAVMTLQPAKKRGAFVYLCFQCTESQGESSLIFSGSALCGTYAARIRMVWSRGNRGGAAQFLLF